MIRSICICASTFILTGTFIGMTMLAYAGWAVGEYQIAIRSSIMSVVSIFAFIGIYSLDNE